MVSRPWLQIVELARLQRQRLVLERLVRQRLVLLRGNERELERLEGIMSTGKLAKLIAWLHYKAGSKGEGWATSLGWFIPRKYRGAVLGDIMEDCVEMRDKGCTERRIKIHVIFQWSIAVIMLVPTGAKAWIADLVKQVIGR